MLLLAQTAMKDRPLSWTLVGWIAVLLIAFAALMERADMYNSLWNAVIQPQFLASDTDAPNNSKKENDKS
jgi:hypothetical protein